MLKHIHSNRTPAPLSAHSDAVLIPPGAQILITSGMLGMRPDGAIPETIEEQVEAAFDNVEAVLSEVGMTMADVVKMTAFITDASYRDAYREERARRIVNPPPSSTRVVITALAQPAMKVEIEIIAAKVPQN